MEQHETSLVIMSPPSESYAALRTTKANESFERKDELGYLVEGLDVAERQLEAGRHFLLEIPYSSKVWKG